MVPGIYTFAQNPQSLTAPTYPRVARAALIQGSVSARLVLNTDGSVKQVQNLQGNKYLVAELPKDLESWIFNSSQDPKRTVDVVVHFEIKSPELSYESAPRVRLTFGKKIEVWVTANSRTRQHTKSSLARSTEEH